MSKTSNHKLKVFYILKILYEKTDENHKMTMSEILKELEVYGISAERKSVYSDIETLRSFGIDVVGEPMGKTFNYYIASRKFELAELKLLVDSVQSAKFITAKKSDELIKKIEGLTSKYEASQLHRQVYIAERVKTMNESIYYNVDIIHSAIEANSSITFQYFQWNVNKKPELRRNGELYKVSPFALSWDDENYYLIAYDDSEKIIKHFRVDKMLHINKTGTKRAGEEAFKKFDMAIYSKKVFGMFGGREQTVRLNCVNSLAGVIIDRFGKDAALIKIDDEHFEVSVNVVVSMQFLAWVIALGNKVKITAPDSVVQILKDEIDLLREQYDM